MQHTRYANQRVIANKTIGGKRDSILSGVPKDSTGTVTEFVEYQDETWMNILWDDGRKSYIELHANCGVTAIIPE